MDKFRVALTGDFLKPDGSPSYPSVDFSALADDPDIEHVYLPMDFGTWRSKDLPAAQLEDFDALITMDFGFGRVSVPESGRLGLVTRFGVGFDDIDLAACNDNGIALVNAPDGVRRPVAVAVVGLMLALTLRLVEKDRLARGGPAGWARTADFPGVGLIGRTLGIVGLGSIGAEVARLARPFGLRIVAHDPFADASLALRMGVPLIGIDELFTTADIVSVNCPLGAKTRGLISARLFGLMRPTAFFINTSRGGVIDQNALIETLKARRIAGAGLDVTDPEPLPAESPLARLDNVILAPHSLCATDQCFADLAAADLGAVLALKHGHVPRNVVNRQALDHPRWQARLASLKQRYGG